MSSLHSLSYGRQMMIMVVLSVVAWIAFASFFRAFWPGGSQPAQNLTLFAIWFVSGTIIFVGLLFFIYRLFRTPPAWRANTALALTAPALVCDVLTINFFESWFPNGGGADDRIYAAFIVGVVGIFQLVGLFTTDPHDTQPTVS